MLRNPLPLAPDRYDKGDQDRTRRLIELALNAPAPKGTIQITNLGLTFSNEFTLTVTGSGQTSSTNVALATVQPNAHTWSLNQTFSQAVGVGVAPSGSFGLQVDTQLYNFGTRSARFEDTGDDGVPLFTNGTVGVEIQGHSFALGTAVIRSFNRTSLSGGAYDKLAIMGAPLDICPNFSGLGATIVSGGNADTGSSGQLFRILTSTFVKATMSLVATQTVAGDAASFVATHATTGKFLLSTQTSAMTVPWMGLQSGTFTGSGPTFFDISQTWNTSSIVTGIKVAVSNTLAGTGSKFLDFLGGASGSTSLFSVDQFGDATALSLTVNPSSTSGVATGVTVNQAASTTGISVAQVSGVNASAVVISGGTLTGSAQFPILDLALTWNTLTIIQTAVRVNVTDSASDSTSRLIDLQVGGSSRFRVEKGGNVTLTPNVAIALTVTSSGGSGASSVFGTGALNTTATDGFVYLPTCAGAPTGTPTTHTGTVACVYDTTNNKLYVYNGAWKSVVLA